MGEDPGESLPQGKAVIYGDRHKGKAEIYGGRPQGKAGIYVM